MKKECEVNLLTIVFEMSKTTTRKHMCDYLCHIKNSPTINRQSRLSSINALGS